MTIGIAIAVYILCGVLAGVVTLRWWDIEEGEDSDPMFFLSIGIVALLWPIYLTFVAAALLGWLIVKGVRR